MTGCACAPTSCTLRAERLTLLTTCIMWTRANCRQELNNWRVMLCTWPSRLGPRRVRRGRGSSPQLPTAAPAARPPREAPGKQGPSLAPMWLRSCPGPRLRSPGRSRTSRALMVTHRAHRREWRWAQSLPSSRLLRCARGVCPACASPAPWSLASPSPCPPCRALPSRVPPAPHCRAADKDGRACIRSPRAGHRARRAGGGVRGPGAAAACAWSRWTWAARCWTAPRACCPPPWPRCARRCARACVCAWRQARRGRRPSPPCAPWAWPVRPPRLCRSGLRWARGRVGSHALYWVESRRCRSVLAYACRLAAQAFNLQELLVS